MRIERGRSEAIAVPRERLACHRGRVGTIRRETIWNWSSPSLSLVLSERNTGKKKRKKKSHGEQSIREETTDARTR